ncbi:MAG: YqjF family protein [Phycisphaeraceae bacterium]
MARSALPHGGHSMEANNAARGPVVMHQRWRDLLFLHWDVPAEIVAHTLPTGLEVDAFEGKAWLGIVPFRMEGVRPRGLPAVPGISAFGELNLRTYVVGPDGTPGVWFYSLDAHQRLAVWLARKLFHLPYVWADIVPRRDGRRVRYAWSREGKADREKPSFVYDTPPDAGTTRAAPAEAGGLDAFLVERYVLFSYGAKRGRLYAGRVVHEPYRIARPEVHALDASLFERNGFDPPGRSPAHVTWSPGVDVKILPLRRIA